MYPKIIAWNQKEESIYIQRVNNKKNTTVVPTKSDSDVIFCLHLLS